MLKFKILKNVHCILWKPHFNTENFHLKGKKSQKLNEAELGKNTVMEVCHGAYGYTSPGQHPAQCELSFSV